MTEMISIGKVIKTQGIKGDLKIFPYLDYPEHVKELDFVFLNDQKFEVQKIRFQSRFVVMKLKGCDSIDSGKQFVGCLLEIPKNKLKKLSSDQFYWHDLIGLTVFDESGHEYGKVESIFPTGSNDVFLVKDKENERLLPAIKDVIKEVDIKNKKIIIHLINGLFD